MKKKRIFWLLVAIALGVVTWKAGWEAAALIAAAFVLALGLLYAVQLATAHIGLGRLRAHHAAYSLEAQLARLEAAARPKAELRFAVFGDSRNNRRVAAMILDEVARRRPHLAFHTGDIVRRGSPSEFLRNHVALLPRLEGIPLFCVPGNHDRGRRRDFKAFRVLHGADHFAFSCGGCRFVGFNNSVRERLGERQLAFLRESLEGPEAHKFVFFHIPPRFFEEQALEGAKARGFTRNAEAMHTLFIEKGVREVFMAHIHGYATLLRDGVRYTLTAGAGAPLRKDLGEGARHHFIEIAVRANEVGRQVVYREGDQWVAREDSSHADQG